MKKNVFILAINVLAVSSVAHAQSSVTLYGIIDEGIDYISNVNGKSFVGLIAGETSGSRWGLRGSEDLGGGLSAVFRLENGFNPNTGKLGQGGTEFGRQAYVGFKSAQYGTFTVGRQMNAAADLWAGFTAAGNTIGDFASHPLDNDNADWDYRNNNVVKYVTPSYLGLQGEATYAFSNSTNFSDNRQYSLATTYTAGNFSSAVAYSRANNPSSSTNPNGAISPTSAFGFVGSAQQDIDAGVKWNFNGGLNNIGLAYSRVDVYATRGGVLGSNVTGTTLQNQNSWKFDNFELNGQYFFTPAFWTAASYTFTHAGLHGASYQSAAWHQVALMFDYDLSKRTSLYIQGAYQHANRVAAQTLGANVEGLEGDSNSQNQALVRIAMTHHF